MFVLDKVTSILDHIRFRSHEVLILIKGLEGKRCRRRAKILLHLHGMSGHLVILATSTQNLDVVGDVVEKKEDRSNTTMMVM